MNRYDLLHTTIAIYIPQMLSILTLIQHNNAQQEHSHSETSSISKEQLYYVVDCIMDNIIDWVLSLLLDADVCCLLPVVWKVLRTSDAADRRCDVCSGPHVVLFVLLPSTIVMPSFIHWCSKGGSMAIDMAMTIADASPLINNKSCNLITCIYSIFSSGHEWMHCTRLERWHQLTLLIISSLSIHAHTCHVHDIKIAATAAADVFCWLYCTRPIQNNIVDIANRRLHRWVLRERAI